MIYMCMAKSAVQYLIEVEKRHHIENLPKNNSEERFVFGDTIQCFPSTLAFLPCASTELAFPAFPSDHSTSIQLPPCAKFLESCARLSHCNPRKFKLTQYGVSDIFPPKRNRGAGQGSRGRPKTLWNATQRDVASRHFKFLMARV